MTSLSALRLAPVNALPPRPVVAGEAAAPLPARQTPAAEPVSLLPKRPAYADKRTAKQARVGETATMPGVIQRAAVGFDRGRREALVDRLKNDAALSGALQRWGALTPDQRLSALRQVASHMGEVYRFTPAPMRPVKLPADESGAYDDVRRRVELSTRELASKDPRDILDTVIHEQLHAYQHQKVLQRRQGQLPEGSALRRQAMVWGHNDDRYIPADRDETAYRKQPVEAHAYANAEAIVRGLLGPAPGAAAGR
jgi:hypothetical protein